MIKSIRYNPIKRELTVTKQATRTLKKTTKKTDEVFREKLKSCEIGKIKRYLDFCLLKKKPGLVREIFRGIESLQEKSEIITRYTQERKFNVARELAKMLPDRFKNIALSEIKLAEEV